MTSRSQVHLRDFAEANVVIGVIGMIYTAPRNAPCMSREDSKTGWCQAFQNMSKPSVISFIFVQSCVRNMSVHHVHLVMGWLLLIVRGKSAGLEHTFRTEYMSCGIPMIAGSSHGLAAKNVVDPMIYHILLHGLFTVNWTRVVPPVREMTLRWTSLIGFISNWSPSFVVCTTIWLRQPWLIHYWLQQMVLRLELMDVNGLTLHQLNGWHNPGLEAMNCKAINSSLLVHQLMTLQFISSYTSSMRL